MKSKKAMAVLCALAVVFTSSGVLPFGGVRLFDTAITASAYDNNPYESLVNTTTVVKFNNIEWYLIADNSTAIDSGTVTLFTKNCVGSSKYNNSKGDGNSYSGSVIESAVNTYYSENFTDVSSAVVDDKLFLLTETEANSLITNIRCCPLYDSSQWRWRYSSWAWWTCSPGQRYSYDARCIIVKDTTYYTTENLDVRNINGIRPALKLDLSKVVFDETEKIFTLKQSTVAVTDITLSETTKTVHEGESFALTATVSPDDATDKTVTWSSDNEEVATVDENGKVTAVKAGTATITATATNGTDDTADDKTAACAVTVDKAQIDPIYTVTIPTEVDLKSSEPVEITAEDVALNEGQKIIVTLDSASNTDSGSEFSAKTASGKSEVKYKINDGAIGLDDSNKTVAEFTGNGERELNFAVTDESGIKYAGVHSETLTFGVSVEQSEPATVAVSGITIDNAPTEALFVNSTGTLTATVSPDNATDKTVVWSSSDPDYVSINAETGEYTVMGKKGYGSATITATATNGTEDTSDDVSATCTITGKVTYTSLSAGTVLHVGDTFYAGKVYFNTKPAVSFQDSNGVITLVENNGCYKFQRGSNGTMPNVTAYKVKDNTDGVYIVSGSGTTSDKFTLAVHTK